MFTRWIPWKFLIKHAARAYGTVDPFTIIARIRRFAQPSEVQEPIELLRAGLVFHARGLVNTKAIQHNLDWIWPFWVEKQFNPQDPSFIPRAYSLTHVNLTHRNWTAIGQPGLPLYPIIDPRGLVTPLYDGWSLDFWVVSDTGEALIPSRLANVDQHWEPGDELALTTRCETESQWLATSATVQMEEDGPWLHINVRASSRAGGAMVIALRPYNPEGIQFIEEIAFDEGAVTLRINDETDIYLAKRPAKVLFSNYTRGDVAQKLLDPETTASVSCPVGMGTAAALFSLPPEAEEEVHVRIPLRGELAREGAGRVRPWETWPSVLDGAARLSIPDKRIAFLYDTAVRTLILLSAGDAVPGPYTYKRFWYRDAALMINAILALGLWKRSERLLEGFFQRQKRSGYFQSQEGEWDSNGQVLWIVDRFQRLSGRSIERSWMDGVLKGARWIARKRLPRAMRMAHAGLLPAGFSAEHFGPNDYYYWDDFWGIAGLRAAARLARLRHLPQEEKEFLREAVDFEAAVFESIASTSDAIPASPYRRMDAGAIGSLAADYPLQLTAQGDPRIVKTAAFLLEHCLQNGAFFQDMIHSGINAYLTLALAQTLLRNEDTRYRMLVDVVAGLASPTGQWPEAIHPRTGGGCMGDGQHGWAAAEWVMMIRNLFVREEQDALVVGSGIFPEWIAPGEEMRFGPTLTPYGPVTVALRGEQEALDLAIEASWRGAPPVVKVAVPGFEKGKISTQERMQHHLKAIQA